MKSVNSLLLSLLIPLLHLEVTFSISPCRLCSDTCRTVCPDTLSEMTRGAVVSTLSRGAKEDV